MAAAWRDIDARLGELGGDSLVRFNWSVMDAECGALDGAACCLHCWIAALNLARPGLHGYSWGRLRKSSEWK